MAALVVLLRMRGDVEGAGSGDEVLRVVGLVGACRDASRTGLLPFVEHQQGGVALGMRRHRGRDQTVTVLAHDPDTPAWTPCHSSSHKAVRPDRWSTDGSRSSASPVEVRAVTIGRAILLAEALLPSLGINQRAVDG